MKMTRKICFRLAGDTGVAVMAIGDGKDGSLKGAFCTDACSLSNEKHLNHQTANS